MSEETAELPQIVETRPSVIERVQQIAGKYDISVHLRALTHFLVITLVLAALNWLFAKDDPGWLKLNPSPWVVLPYYIGFRFGFFWGVGSGMLLLIFRLLMAAGGSEAVEFSGADQFLLWGMVLMGAIGGFTRGLLYRKEKQQLALLETSQESNKMLKRQVALLKHNEQDLSASLVARELEISGLTISLQDIVDRLAEADRDEAFLHLLRDRCGVKSAAIYFSSRAGQAIRVVQLRSDSAFPGTLDRTPMFEHAERTGKIVTQRWFWEAFEPNATGGLDDYFLAVVAHPRNRDFRILVISRMDFEAIHWENFWKIESAFRWYENAGQITKGNRLDSMNTESSEPGENKREQIIETEIAEADGPSSKAEQPEPAKPATEAKPILDAPGFKLRLGQCRQIEEQMGLAHRIVVFVPGEQESHERCEAFAQTLNEIMPPTDDLARIPSDGGRFVYGLLTPAPTTESAEQHASELLAKLPDLDLRFFVLTLKDEALRAFTS